MNIVRDYKPNKGLGYRVARKKGKRNPADQYTGSWEERADGSSDYYQEPVSSRAKFIVNLTFWLIGIAILVWFFLPIVMEAVQWPK